MCCSSLQERLQQMRKTRYDVNVCETRLEIPMLKKYLPPYQAPGLIEELKEHDRMRLIQEREARRCMTALRSTKDSSLSVKSRDPMSCDTSITCDAHGSVSRLTSVRKFILLLHLKVHEILKFYYVFDM